MGKPRVRSVLYRLIEAGQLARLALHSGLGALGLEPGDDAILFLLRDHRGVSATEISAALSVSREALARRLRRLESAKLVEVRAVGPQLVAGYALTGEGNSIRQTLADSWDELEDALLRELGRKQSKGLRRALERVIERLDPDIRPDA